MLKHLRRGSRGRPNAGDVCRRTQRARPQLELLEDRLVPAVFNVNSTADILTPPLGVVTLRSAIQAANTNTDATNTINLTVPGTYAITLAGTPGETDNAAGEFAILPHTSPSTLLIQNTSGGTVVVDANHLNRVFDINPGNTNDPATKLAVTMQGFTIQNGNAFDPANPDGATSSGGGIRDQGNANLTLTNMVLTTNIASADGGGVSMENAPVSTPWTLTLNNTTVSNNRAGDAGGGVETDGTGRVFINAGSVLTGNSCLNQGAAVWLDAIGAGSADLTMTGVVVSDNTATNGPTGAIGNAGTGAVTITSCTVLNNVSGTTGGGFGDENNLGSLTVSNSIFRNNSAVGDGGGIQEGGPRTTITDSLIGGNTSGGSGGGIFANGTTLTLQDSTLTDNSAGAGGGGLDIQTSGTGSSGSVILNTTFYHNSALNSAGANGGGIGAPDAFGGTVSLVNDTLNGNFATNGGGIFWAGIQGSAFTLQNTIVAQNTAATGADANNAASAFTDDGGNLIGISGAGSGNTGFTAGTTQTGTLANPLNPLLGPLANNGGPSIGASGAETLLTEALLPGSPAIDKGVSNALTTDERGFPRPEASGEVPDVGAFEFQDTTLAIAVTPAAALVTQGSSDSFDVAITNTSGNALPADNSTLRVALSAGLTPTSALTFSLGALAAGQTAHFTVTATANALGSQEVTASATSADANPNTVSSSATIVVIASPTPTPPPTPSPTPPPSTMVTPVGSLFLFGIGFGPGFSLGLFQVDSQGNVFEQPLSFFGPSGALQFINSKVEIPIKDTFDGQLLALLQGSDGQFSTVAIFSFGLLDPFVFWALLTALVV